MTTTETNHQSAGNQPGSAPIGTVQPGPDPTRPHRGTIFVEDAEIIAHDRFPGDQVVLRIAAPRVARAASPGTFVHLQCDRLVPMRRPLSIMRADPVQGWAEFLYKIVGEGTRRLCEQKVGAVLSVVGPIGHGFESDAERPRALLVGGGVGIPPMVFLADRMRFVEPRAEPLVLMGSEAPFPFPVRPSEILVPSMPDGVIGCMPLMEDWGIASRLASNQGFAGCHDGYVTDLARVWLDALPEAERRGVTVYACGPTPMLAAISVIASEFDVPCQVSLEEYMACAVGGCAGCVVRVDTPAGPAMKRVCVDGPVFDAASIAWAD